MSSLGVTIWRGEVYRAGRDILQPIQGEEPLGRLAGATAEVMDAGSRAAHERSGGKRTADTVVATALLGPVGLLAGMSRMKQIQQRVVLITFADGAVFDHLASGDSVPVAVRSAARFNAMAAKPE